VGINKCYAADCFDKLPKPHDFPDTTFNSKNELETDNLLDFANNQSNKYVSSVAKRLVGILNIQTSRDYNTELDIISTWRLISDSILLIPSSDTISSIGSQGFLSIPLFKFDKTIENFEFLRLHIWDDSISQYINKEDCENFSIHTHAFHAKSWIIFGEVINDRYIVNKSNSTTGKSLFTIDYNKTLNKVNQHTSNASNLNSDVFVKQISHEIHMTGGNYEIKVGDFHKSGTSVPTGLSATFFSFTSKDGLANHSYVVGPSNMKNSIINRKMHIDPANMIGKLNLEVDKL
jgi:hypothetical protein